MKRLSNKTLIILLKLFIIGSAGTVIGFSAIYLYLSPNLPSVESIRDVRLQTPLRIYSADNKLIGEFGEKRRRPVKLKDVPKPFIDALLAAEDFDFYSHNGVSIKGLARAVTELITTGQKGSGGSTLTMQLTRNVFLSLDTKYIRKFNEILLSLKLERELSKDEILELYVNYMFLGKRAYGIQSAAQVYYGKDLNQLSLAQLAMIAGLFQGPSTQNPIINPTRAVERRNWILGRMRQLELINEEQYELASNEKVSASYHGSPLEADAPYIAELAREKAIRSFGLEAYTEGYRVYTTVDSRLQMAAQRAVAKGLIAYDQRHGFRGAEQNLGEITEATNNAQQSEQDVELATIAQIAAWQEQLDTIPEYAELAPAVVTQINEDSIDILTKTGEISQITWENGLSSARPYISENARGPSPKTSSDILKRGDVIRTTLNENNQWQLSQLPDAQAALVALAPSNGAIISIVGGFNFYQSHFNRATQAYRQAGSNLKPFIYATALEQGMTASTLINDAPIVFEDATLEDTWRPENSSGKFYGPTRIRKALYLSRNLVSIRILQQLGISTTINSLERFGFDAETLPRDLSLALGSHSVTPIDLATAWATFANNGHKVGAHLINRVVDIEGNIIYEAFPDTVCHKCETQEANIDSSNTEEINYELNPADIDFDVDWFALPVKLKRELGLLEDEDYPRAPKILDDQVAFIMNSILQDVIARGTGVKARVLNRPDLAGKTGTTNGPLDAWFSGYNSDIITTTWVGFDQNKALGDAEYGGSAALPIWIDFMREALKGTKVRQRPQPDGIVTIKIDPETGKRASADTPDAMFEYFREEFAPQEDASETREKNNPLEVLTEGIF